MVPRKSIELLENELSAVVQAGDYTSKEAVRAQKKGIR